VDIRIQSELDQERVEALVSFSFPDEHAGRAVWKLRPGKPIDDLCLVASDYRNIVGSLRFWEITVAGRPQLLLGPLAILPEVQGRGFGRALVSDGLRRAEQMRRWSFVILSGDPEYYKRFGFAEAETGRFIWPGPLAPNKLLTRPLKRKQEDTHLPGPMALMPNLNRQSEI
jgi:predicted N-acetyltransferase YhbS